MGDFFGSIGLIDSGDPVVCEPVGEEPRVVEAEYVYVRSGDKNVKEYEEGEKSRERERVI